MREAAYLGSGHRQFTKLQLLNCKRNNVYADAKLNREKGSEEGFLKQTRV